MAAAKTCSIATDNHLATPSNNNASKPISGQSSVEKDEKITLPKVKRRKSDYLIGAQRGKSHDSIVCNLAAL